MFNNKKNKKHELKSLWFVRIYLKVDLMYSMGLTMRDIVSKLTDDKDSKICCVASPLNIGIIDIYNKNSTKKDKRNTIL